MRSTPPTAPVLSVNSLSMGFDAFVALAAAMQCGLANSRATFECVLSGDGAFAVMAGLEPLLDALERFRMKADEITYLRDAGAIDAKLAQRLADARFTCDVDAAPEGSVVFPGAPVIVVDGPFWQAQLVEAWVVSSVDVATQVASQMARAVIAADGVEVLEAGTTHTNRLGGNPLLARAAFVGGAGATTHALAGRRYGVPVRSRQPRNFVLACKNEQAAFEAWLKGAGDQAILRIDSRHPGASIDHAVAAARSRATASWSDAPLAIEVDAGEVVDLSNIAIERFAKAGLKSPVIVVAGDLDPQRIDELRRSGAPVAAFVVEPTVAPLPLARYALAAIEEGGQWSPRINLGPDLHATRAPGRKVLLRYFDADGHPVGDVSHANNERHMSPKDAKLVDERTGYTVRLDDAASSAPVLHKVMRAGKRVESTEPARESRERSLRAVQGLLPKHKRLVVPAHYPVGLTTGLAHARDELAAKQR